MSVVAVALVGRSNECLFLRSFVEEETLRFHSIAHMSLDLIEERLAVKRAPDDAQDSFLGMLAPVEEYKMWAYVTNSSLKLLLITEDVPISDETMRPLFKSLHALYVDTVSNPFMALGTKVTSSSFERAVVSLLAAHRVDT